MRQHDYFHKRALKSNTSEDWANYCRFRNRVTNEIRSARASYNKRLIEKSGGDHRSFWKRMKKILPGEKKVTSPNIKINDVVSSDKQCIANAFNKFFASAASKLMATVRSTCGHNHRDPNTSIRQYPPFNFLEISEEFVLSQLRSLKSGKAVGLDRIPARLLKDSADIVVKPVTFIINTSLRTSKVPCDWKSARVIPLFKKGKADEMDNYRPVSILPVLSKVLERAVHINCTNIFSKTRF